MSIQFVRISRLAALVAAFAVMAVAFAPFTSLAAEGDEHTITASAGTGGTISPDGDTVIVEPLDQDADQTYTINASSGYVIADVLVDDVSVGAVSTYTFDNVIEDHTIEASFERLPFVTIEGSSTEYSTIQAAINAAVDGDVINVSAGTFTESVNVNKQVTIQGAGSDETTLVVANVTETNGFTVTADNVTITGFHITGPSLNQSYITYPWNSPVVITRGIFMMNGADNFTITDNVIEGLRNNILIDGRNVDGEVTNNTIDNSKSGISVQYTSAGILNGTPGESFILDISDNEEGSYGNEWGVNLHLNGHDNGTGTLVGNSTKISATAPIEVQQALLALSAANDGWTVQDQGYSNANRTEVFVSATGTGTQGSPAGPLASIQAGVDAIVDTGIVHVAAGSYTGNIAVSRPASLEAESTSAIITGQITVSGDNVTVSGFSITNPNGNFGILVSSANDVTISDNIISDIATGTATGNSYGIYFQDSDAESNNDLLVEDNVISDIGKTTNGSNGGIGIGDSTGTGVLSGFIVRGNTISDIIANPLAVSPGKGAYGIIVNHAVAPTHTGSTSDILIEDNTISGLNGRWAHAIGLEGATPNAVVTGNTVSDVVGTTGDAAGIFFEQNAHSASVTVEDNSFDTTSMSFGADSRVATAVDVSLNFWNTGTTSPASKIAGSNVTFAPWYTDETMTIVAYTTTTTATETSANSGSEDTTLEGESTEEGDDNVTVTAEIPAGTTISGDPAWDGTISAPTAVEVSINIAGPTPEVTSAIEIGSSEYDLTFDQGVKLTFEGQAGTLVGWFNAAGDFAEITAVCADDSQATGDALAAGADCKIDSGADLVVWTKHFSIFATYTIPGSSGGGGGGGSSNNNDDDTTTDTGSVGEVLGAATFTFTTDLMVGSTGAEVTELQKILIAAGLLQIDAPTGYFGELTKAALIKWQIAHNVPGTGYFGPLTRAAINASVMAPAPTAAPGLTAAQREKLQEKLIEAMQELIELLEKAAK